VNTRNQNYQKRWDFGGTVLPTEWSILELGAGMTVGVAGGVLSIASGTTAGAETVIRCSKALTLKVVARFIAMLSQRIANQAFYLELTNEAGTTEARWLFDGTSATSAKVESENGGVANAAVTLTTPNSAAYATYEIFGEVEQVLFAATASNSNAVKGATALFDRNIPEPGELYYLQIRALNGGTAPASSTTFNIDAVLVEDLETVAVEILRAEGAMSPAAALGIRAQGGTIDQVSTAFMSPRTSRVTETGTNLAAAATFTGGGRDTGSTGLFDEIRVFCLASHAGTLFIEQSSDNAVWFQTNSQPTTAGAAAEVFTFPIALRYVRVRYVNGATATTTFRLDILLLGH
jgi:hypothetical protein